MRILLQSAYVAPIDRPLIRDGAVLIANGIILAVGYPHQLRAQSDQTIDLGNSILLPGLVNAHTHLELSDLTQGERPSDGLEGWLVRMLTRTRLDQAELEHRSAEGVRHGIQQCLRYGVTTIGDISRQCHITRPFLRDGPLLTVSFGEVMAMAQRRYLLEERLQLATDTSCAGDNLIIGLTPHAPYSIEIDGYRRCVEVAKANSFPLATHLAETKAEWQFLAEHTGPLKELWDAWLSWDSDVPRFSGGPIRMAQATGLLDYPTVLAHVNYCSDEELAILAQGKASVVYCPRTHDYFGHPPHRFRDMLAHGINVALGTDSCASSPNLNLLDDARLLRQRYPELPADLLWQMLTRNGARALGLADRVGSLAPGRRADLLAFAISTSDPLAEVLDHDAPPQQLWIAGKAT